MAKAKSRNVSASESMATAEPSISSVPSGPVSAEATTAKASQAYTVVARRYRPQQFADLIGQEHVAEALGNTIRSGRIAHAYLFTGGRGVGKTSCARILAKALDCVSGPTPTPCDRCEICLGIASGDDVDVLEIDGASNNKVDEIRDLRQNVVFRPTRARFKIYIIDEVHMLSNSAFNALLKTLEEPPPHVKFIFATTEVQKIPITILSRCQRFDFASVTTAKIADSLLNIVRKEGLPADDDALRLIARRAAGSMRDSQTLLDQLLGFSDGPLTVARVHALLGTAPDERILQLAEAVLANDPALALEALTHAVESGILASELTDQLIEFWRGMMLVSVAGAGTGIRAGELLEPAIVEHGRKMNLDAIMSGLDILVAAKSRMRGSPHGNVLLELAILRLARMNVLLSLSQLTQLATNPNLTTISAGVSPSESARPSSTSSPQTPTRVSVLPAPPPPFENTGEKSKTPATATAESTQYQKYADVKELLGQLISTAGPLLSAHLSSPGIRAAISGPNAMVIRVTAEYASIGDHLKSERSVESIVRELKKLTGHDWAVRIETIANEPAIIPDRGAETSPATTRPKESTQHPVFRSANEILGAQLLRVDEGFNLDKAAVADIFSGSGLNSGEIAAETARQADNSFIPEPEFDPLIDDDTPSSPPEYDEA